MQRIRIRRLIYFGALALLEVIVLGFWYYQSAREKAAVSAEQHRFEYQAAEKTSVPQYDPPAPTPPARPPNQQSYVPPLPPPPTRPVDNPTAAPSRDQAMPDFPWPPPKASAWAEIPNDLVVAGASAPTFEVVRDRLARALDAAGYHQRSLFAVPRGFAVVTQLERIDSAGVPAGSGRWQVSETSGAFSLVAYLKRLLYAEPGRYRLVVLIVSDRPFSASGGYLTASEASDLASRGVNALPQDVADERYSPRHLCTALIYEFRKVPDAPPEFVAPSPLQGYDHLVRANIWAALAAAQKK